MKKLLSVFCPPGAEWNYHFAWYGNQFYNEKITYVRDTVITPDTLKLLRSTRLYFNCNPCCNFYTYIKQKGDTIFFKNFATQYTWQILYNFAAQAGQGWQTTFQGLPSGSLTTTSYTVSSVSTVTINNIPLKRLNIGSDYVTERLGWKQFLFMLKNTSGCDGEIFISGVCYRDNAIGLVQYTSYDCDSEGILGLNNLNERNYQVKLSPNPTKDLLNVETNLQEEIEIEFTDLSGRKVKQLTFRQTQKIDLSGLEKGIYFLRVYEGKSLIATEKIIKE